MKIEENNTNENETYAEFQRWQTIVSELVKDDVVILTINGIAVFNEIVKYGSNTHVNINLQDMGEKDVMLTDKQIAEAIANYKKTL